MNILKLAKECEIIFDTSEQLEAFAQAVIEEYKASLEPMAWMYVSSKTSCDKLSLDRPINGFIPNTEFQLYALGEIK